MADAQVDVELFYFVGNGVVIQSPAMFSDQVRPSFPMGNERVYDAVKAGEACGLPACFGLQEPKSIRYLHLSTFESHAGLVARQNYFAISRCNGPLIVNTAGMKLRDCSYCKGTGKEMDPIGVGAEMRRLRRAARKTQQEVGDYMHLCKQHICALEKGNRNWNEELISNYKKALLQ